MEPIAAHVVLGQEQDKLTDGFNEDQSFSGRMSQVGLWNRILSREELEQMASCAIEFPTGSVIPWNMGSWNISDHVGQETTKATFCQDDPLEDILLISDPISADENLELCQKVGGSVPYASSASELEVVIKRVRSAFANARDDTPPYTGSSFSLGNRRDLEGRWVDPSSGSPSGGGDFINHVRDSTRCARYLEDLGPAAMECDHKVAGGVCFLPKGHSLTLKGLTSSEVGTSFDRKFYIRGIRNGKPHLK